MLAYSAVGFKISADLAGFTGRCRRNSFLVEISADSAELPGPTGRCNNFLVERALS